MGKVAHNRTHGMVGTNIYKTWVDMKTRCYNAKAQSYRNYGGRGIRVCDRWQQFENFYRDMGERPKGKTLERIHNDRDYSPENVRWATRKEQANNRRSSRIITFEGASKTLEQWAEHIGISPQALDTRLKTWTLQEALTLPRCHRKKV